SYALLAAKRTKVSTLQHLSPTKTGYLMQTTHQLCRKIRIFSIGANGGSFIPGTLQKALATKADRNDIFVTNVFVVLW
ncbi:MAG: hypothetical protein ACLVL2_18870, partial [Bacteroides cellulosilyticus]